MKQMIIAVVFAITMVWSWGSALGQGKADWPMFIGDGSRVPAKQGYELVDDLNEMRVHWRLRRHMTVGKGLYPGTLRAAREMGIEPFYGGASNPIIADGKVFVNYYKPDGKSPAEVKGWRTVSKPEEFLPPWFFSVTADDILLAVDAETGEIVWEAVEEGKGLNRLAHKRAHWVRSPAYADGRVFNIGSMGLLYAYDAKKGKKLWEVSTSPDLEKAREEHIKAKKLYWGAEDQSSLIVAEGVVIVARETMSGYDAKTGERVWHIGERIMSKHATPTIWHHDGREYVLAHTGRSGELRLIDPKDGKVLWTHTGLGPRLGTLSVGGDFVLVAYASEKGEKDKGGTPRLVRYGALRLSLKGPEKLWVMPDDPGYWFHWKHDKGPRYRTSIRDGLVFLTVGMEEYKDPSKRLKLMVLDVESGKIHYEQFTGVTQGLGNPIPMEDKLWMNHDYAHTHPITQSYWTAEKQPRKLNGLVALPHRAITGYYIDLEPIYYKGRVYFRTLEGMICYDMRKPDAEKSQTLRLSVPSEVTGLRGETQVNLYVRDGEVTHGGIPRSDTIHAADPSGVKYEKKQSLTGVLGLALRTAGRAEPYRVVANVSREGAIAGQITAFERGFKKPIPLAGRITSMAHQPAWMPSCTHVLSLDGAALNAGGDAGRLLLFLTVEDGGISRVEGWADQTTKTPPSVFADDLDLSDGRVRGEVTVRYRADEWTTPLVEHGVTVAARYSIDCALEDGERLGNYRGSYGIEWSRSAEVRGEVVR